VHTSVNPNFTVTPNFTVSYARKYSIIEGPLTQPAEDVSRAIDFAGRKVQPDMAAATSSHQPKTRFLTAKHLDGRTLAMRPVQQLQKAIQKELRRNLHDDRPMGCFHGMPSHVRNARNPHAFQGGQRNAGAGLIPVAPGAPKTVP
jgi:hypothetical protein